MRNAVSVIWILLAMLLAVSVSSALGAQQADRNASRDSAAVVALEHRWLAAVSDSVALNEILAPDFVHALPTGQFINKGEHIAFAVQHPRPSAAASRFERLEVRVYGSTAIATGIVSVSTDGVAGVKRTVFTDVFLSRHGRWQAVTAQETELVERR